MALRDADIHFDGPGEDAAEEREFITTLYRNTIQNKEEDERLIAERARNWEADRITLSDMLLMRMALTEARSFELIPVKVTLNEY
ncbi:MAG TPA: transcription antitermination factor NusB, partial [Flavobacteriales bacterium]|nr:transcription antitermination factor NusB [Flavobacteriales bacterium]